MPVIASLQAFGVCDLRGLAAALNNRGVRTARGGRWHVSNVRNLLIRTAKATAAERLFIGGKFRLSGGREGGRDRGSGEHVSLQNIRNRGRRAAGIRLEITKPLRDGLTHYRAL
jgi:hypothetical protein